MAKQKFKDVRFKPASRELIDHCNAVVTEYMAMGLRLTLRQLYYQLVTKNLIPNVEKSYKKLSGLLTDARYAGLVDWDAIEDRVRVPKRPGEWDSIRELVDLATNAFRLPRWHDQDCYVELWVEKDALAGVLAPIATRQHVTLMVNKGYSSASAMREAAVRFRSYEKKRHRDPKTNEELETWYGVRKLHLLYLGDHDPSGEDMVRDVRNRLHEFGADVEVFKVALTREQIDEYEPPPNPAKVSDPRAAKYIDEHGDESWEVDALPPDVLTRLIEEAIEPLVDTKAMAKVIAQEQEQKKRLRKAMEKVL